MSVTIQTLRRSLAVALTGVALIATGCADSTTPQDVSDARENLREEQQDVAEARQEAQENIADAREDAREVIVNKPITEEANEEMVEAQRDLAEARQEANEAIRDEQEDVAAAAAELRTEEQRLAATQARDAYVKEVEGQLTSIENDINQLETQASNAEGADKDALDLRIQALQAHHDRVEEALDHLKSADLAEWQNHQQHVRTAMQDLDASRSVR